VNFVASMFNDATGNAARKSNNLISIFASRYSILFFGSVLVLHIGPIIHQLLHEMLILLQILKYITYKFDITIGIKGKVIKEKGMKGD